MILIRCLNTFFSLYRCLSSFRLLFATLEFLFSHTFFRTHLHSHHRFGRFRFRSSYVFESFFAASSYITSSSYTSTNVTSSRFAPLSFSIIRHSLFCFALSLYRTSACISFTVEFLNPGFASRKPCHTDRKISRNKSSVRSLETTQLVFGGSVHICTGCTPPATYVN